MNAPISTDTNYWADSAPEQLVGHLEQKTVEYFRALDLMGLRVVWRSAYSQFFGMSPDNPGHLESHEVGFSGEGESIVFRINDFRSFVKQTVSLALGPRPSYRCLAVNDDYDSLAQIESCDAALSYIANRSYGEDLERSKVEQAKLYGWSWDWHRWDDEAGGEVEVYEPDSPTAKSVKSGAPSVTPRSPLQVAHDPSCTDGRHTWLLTWERRSKWELAAEYPVGIDGQDQVEKIVALNAAEQFGFTGLTGSDEFMHSRSSDAVLVRHFYHARTKAMPEGRYVGVAGSLVLWDLPLPSDEIPLVPFMPSRIDGTSFGYSDAWDWLPLQQMLDQIISDRATNVAIFGRPNMYMDEGTNVTVDLLARGGQLFTKPPTTDPPGIIKYDGMSADATALTSYLQSRLRENSGLNAVTRGDPGSNIKSGTMAALFHSMSLEYASADQQAVDASRERNGNMMLQSIKRNARYPFVVEVSGQSELPYASTFESDRFKSVKRVQVVTANPMARTQAGRIEMFNMLMKVPGALSDPSQVIELVTSGQFKPTYEAGRRTKLGVRWENEQLAKGMRIPPAMAGEDPKEINEHFAQLRIPAIRNNPQAVAAHQEHIMSHLQAWFDAAPPLATAMGFPPIQSLMGGAPPPPANDNGGEDIGVTKTAAEAEQSMERGGLGVPLPKAAKSPMAQEVA